MAYSFWRLLDSLSSCRLLFFLLFSMYRPFSFAFRSMIADDSSISHFQTSLQIHPFT